jgi:NitT/TauT family transport system substrate-binding protein
MIARRRFLSGLAAAPLAGALPSAARADSAVRFLIVQSEQSAAPVFAEREGFFKNAGLDVAVTQLANGASVVAAVLGGAADVGVSNPVSLAVAHQHGAPLVAFSPTAYYTKKSPTSLLLVAKNSTIRSGKDLTGKTIAVNGLQNTPQFATELWIDRTGGDSKSVKFIEMHYTEMPSALNSGRVDAAFSAEPALTPALATTRVLADAYGAVAPQFLTGVFITTTSYAQQNPQVVERLAGALRESSRWANAHPDETAEIASSFTKVDAAVLRHMIRTRYAERIAPEDLQPLIDLAARYGLLTNPFPARELIWSPKA